VVVLLLANPTPATWWNWDSGDSVTGAWGEVFVHRNGDLLGI